VICALAMAWGGACRARGPETPAAPIRLVDLYKPQPAASASPTGVGLPPPVEWRFAAAKVEAPARTPAPIAARPPVWTAGPGVQGLAVRDGRLVGLTTADVALIDLERPASDDRDV